VLYINHDAAIQALAAQALARKTLLFQLLHKYLRGGLQTGAGRWELI